MADKVRVCTSLDKETKKILEYVQDRYGMTRSSAISYIAKSWDEERRKAAEGSRERR